MIILIIKIQFLFAKLFLVDLNLSYVPLEDPVDNKPWFVQVMA